MTIAALVTLGIGPGGSVKYAITGGLDLGANDLIARPIIRRGRMRLYRWEEEAPSPDLPPPVVEAKSPEPVWVPEDEPDEPIPEGIAEELEGRLADIERRFVQRAKQAKKARDEAKRKERLQALASEARAEAEQALRRAREQIAREELATAEAERARVALERENEDRLRLLMLFLLDTE